MNLVYRLMAFRVFNASRTTSDEAIMVVAGMILVDVLAKEMSVGGLTTALSSFSWDTIFATSSI